MRVPGSGPERAPDRRTGRPPGTARKRGNRHDVTERWTGREFDVDIGGPAHGGSCIARHEGRVLFVRHALPGERVRVVVTEDTGGSFCRADALAVLEASADRVGPPCPHAGPGR